MVALAASLTEETVGDRESLTASFLTARPWEPGHYLMRAFWTSKQLLVDACVALEIWECGVAAEKVVKYICSWANFRTSCDIQGCKGVGQTCHKGGCGRCCFWSLSWKGKDKEMRGLNFILGGEMKKQNLFSRVWNLRGTLVVSTENICPVARVRSFIFWLVQTFSSSLLFTSAISSLIFLLSPLFLPEQYGPHIHEVVQ